MNYIRKIDEVNTISSGKLEYIGFLFVLSELNILELIDINELAKNFGYTEKKIITLLKKLNEEKIIDINIVKNENGDTIYDIKDFFNILFVLKKVNSFFGIEETILLNISNEYSFNEQVDIEKFKNGFLQYISRQTKIPMYSFNGNRYVINNIEDLEFYFKKIYLGNLISEHNIFLSINDYKHILEMCIDNKLPKELILFIVEYTIKNTSHNNYTKNYANKIYESFLKNNINSVKYAINFCNKIKNYNSKKVEYVEPVYDDEIIEDDYIDDKELEKLF